MLGVTVKGVAGWNRTRWQRAPEQNGASQVGAEQPEADCPSRGSVSSGRSGISGSWQGSSSLCCYTLATRVFLLLTALASLTLVLFCPQGLYPLIPMSGSTPRLPGASRTSGHSLPVTSGPDTLTSGGRTLVMRPLLGPLERQRRRVVLVFWGQVMVEVNDLGSPVAVVTVGEASSERQALRFIRSMGTPSQTLRNVLSVVPDV